MSEIDLNALEKEARQEFEAEKRQGTGGQLGLDGMIEIDEMDDDYDYYESQANRQDRMKSRAKQFDRLQFHPNNRFSVLKKDLDDNVVNFDNVVVFDKKKNAIYSVDGYTTAVGFGDPEHQHKRNWKKKYYSDVNDLERTALAAKLKQQDQNGGAKLPMATKQQIMASVWNSVLIIPAVEILERQDGKIDIYNSSNKVFVQKGDYEYLPLAKRLNKKELPAVISQLYQVEDVDARIMEALRQAMQYYDKYGYDSQRRRTPPIGPPITTQIQTLPELQQLNQSPRQTQSQKTQKQDYITQINLLNYHMNCNPNKAKLTMCGLVIN
ncbi:MAG: hypothetical protein EZS28_007909 [Streblomastix strix]|uniref:Uncharacterized protein n=1 Tax=Streblomastix strix TaxID=222440 RepID=A0A5J4WNA0_9EUKA|nr:MAG: hypothetical protein EZS28_007909 [Streblomastix strix]